MSAENTTQPTGLVARIMAFLKLDDAGKIQNFFDRQVKKFNKDIESYKQAIKNENYNSERKMDGLREKLEDAEQEVDDAYASVKPTDVETNAKQDDFASNYWYKIENAEQKVANIEKAIKSETESTEEKIKMYEEQIKERQNRISKIS